MSVVDLWVNVLTPDAATAFAGQSANVGIAGLFGTDPSRGWSLDEILITMGIAGVDRAVLAHGLSSRALDEVLGGASASGGRFTVAAVVDRPEKPVDQVRRLREISAHPQLSLVRITPLVSQYPLNHRLYYPVYALCAEMGLPVSINVGIPGPRVRSACQHPELLEDVLIDFPGLTIIGAHMGHPYESLLIQYMLKWPSLYLSNSAYLARYMDSALISFMGSSRGRGRVLFASDHPFLPMDRAVAAARALPLDPLSMSEFMGEAATRLLARG